MSPTATPTARKHRPPQSPRSPRRVSGPVRGREVRRSPASRRTASVSSRLVAFIGSLPDHPLLDRIVRGRAWIPLLGALLAGIVAMQIEVLKLGTSMGRSIERSSALATRNGELQASVAALQDDQRIERLAAGMGMIMPAPEAIGFLSAQPNGNVGQALANIHAPDDSSFMSLLYSNGAIVTASSDSLSAGESSGISTAGQSSSAAPADTSSQSAPTTQSAPAASVPFPAASGQSGGGGGE